MSRTSPVKAILRSAGLPAVALILMGFFAYNAVLGPNGFLAYKDVHRQLEARTTDYQAVEKRKNEIKNRVDLLGGKGGADPDLVEEEARKQLNVVRDDEVILPRQPAPAPAKQ
jgi:cell division protein FtsB